MSRIICGLFDGSVDADAALEAFERDGFHRTEVDAFYVSPPGQHAMTPVGGAMVRMRAGRRAHATREHPVEPRGGRMIAVNVTCNAQANRKELKGDERQAFMSRCLRA